MNRVFNSVLAIVGLGLFSWGVYVLSLFHWLPQVSIIVMMSIGLLLALLTGSFAYCGHKRTWFLRAYTYLLSFLLLSNVILAGVCLDERARDSIVKDVTSKVDSSVTKTILDNVLISGYILGGISLLELLSLLFSYCRRTQLLDRAKYFEEFGDETEDYALLDDGSRKNRKQKSAVEMPGESDETDDPARKYRQKYADLYEKYGIGKA